MIQERVISSMALVIERFTANVKAEIPDVKFVYDEKLSYDTSITKFRADNNITPEAPAKDALPLFSFKRSVLRSSERAPGRRMATGIVDVFNKNADGTSDVYKAVHGEMDIDFIFYVKSAADSELFEIEYLSETGMSKNKTLLVDLKADLGVELPYYMEFQPLTDKTMESDNNFFKAISGSVKVTGFYPVFKTNSKHILTICENIYNSTIVQTATPETLISSTVITA